MFWAKNRPVPEATTDFGEMAPAIVSLSFSFPLSLGFRGGAGSSSGADSCAAVAPAASSPAPIVPPLSVGGRARDGRLVGSRPSQERRP
jgi:hypothetical protein